LVRAKIDYLRAAITKTDMLSYPIYNGFRVPGAAQPIASEWELVGAGELREVGIVRVLDLPALRSKVLIQRYMRPNSCGAVDGYPPPQGSSTACIKIPGGLQSKEWGCVSPPSPSADPMSHAVHKDP